MTATVLLMKKFCCIIQKVTVQTKIERIEGLFKFTTNLRATGLSNDHKNMGSANEQGSVQIVANI